MSARGRRIIATALMLSAAGTPGAPVSEWRPGSSTPRFELPAAGGGEVALRDFHGVPVALLFADPQQGHSQRAIEELVSVVDAQRFGQAIRVFIIVDQVPQVLPALPSCAAMLVDEDRSTFVDYGVVAVLPCTVFLDAEGLFHAALPGHGFGYRDSVENELLYLTGRISHADLVQRRQGPAPADPHRAVMQRRLNLANQLRQRGLASQAREEYEAILELVPGDPAAHLGIAQLELQRGHLDEAESHAMTALAASPEMPLAFKTLARARLMAGNLEGVREPLRQFIAIAGEDAETHYLQGRLAEAQGAIDEALAHYRQACEALLTQRGWGLFARESTGRRH